MTVHEILVDHGVVDHPPACKLVVLALVDDVLTRKAIAERIGMSADGTRRAVNRLVAEGVIATHSEVSTGGRPAELVTLAERPDDEPFPETAEA